MALFALIKDGIVTGVIIADQSFIDATPLAVLGADLTVKVHDEPGRPGPDYIYNPDTGLFTAPKG